jgi:tetraacyldisaccharide 4'-kinase
MSPEQLWYGDGGRARVLRAALSPAGWLYRGAVAVRGALYDRGMLRVHPGRIPAVSVGNLTVGGTGKTPLAAHLTAALLARGARPAIVLRGYGEDEPAVHRVLTPGAIVVVQPDRVLGVAEAATQGADVAVLDDAFQHRRAARMADVVLVSVEQWQRGTRTLPVGPGREGEHALSRATLVIVTRKTATAEAAEQLRTRLAAASGAPAAVAVLSLDGLRSPWDASTEPLEALRGQRVLAVAGVGAPQLFARQLESAGARVELAAFPDHHAYDAAELRMLQSHAPAFDRVVCTLKDAVKLAARWTPAHTGLWYVSQRVELESGASHVAALIDAVLDARNPRLHPAHIRLTPPNA